MKNLNNILCIIIIIILLCLAWLMFWYKSKLDETNWRIANIEAYLEASEIEVKEIEYNK
jgi:cytochrome oxidase assembly protein ShyY1